MKVVVMDDEEKVCSLVCALILWDELGLELVGTAGDGLAGLELIKSQNPDILITDIRMPSLDGLKLIEEAKKINPNLQVIIISGYRQFDYAKKAIKFGVSDYLLKPIKQEELLKALRKMVSSFEEKKNYSNYLSNRDGLRAYYLINYLETRKNLNKFEDFFNLSDLISISMIRVDGEFYDYDSKAKEAINNKLKASFAHYFETVNDWEIIYLEKYHSYVLLVSIESQYKDEMVDNYKKAFKEVTINFESLFSNLKLTFCQGNFVNDPKMLLEELSNVNKLSFTRIYNESNNYLDSIEHKLKLNNKKADNFIKKINNIFAEEQINNEKFINLIDSLYSLKDYEFFLTVEEIVKNLYIIFEEQLDSEDFKKISFDTIYFLNSREKIINILNNKLLFVYDLLLAKRKSESAKPIREAKAFILKNYFDNQISLDSISSLVHLSPTYFSTLFKKETNKGFSEYLREIRIEKSTEFLTSTSLPIKEIARKVGYQDPRHFTKCFKSQLGIKPQDYRKLYG